jgi:nucleolar protein 4
MVLRQVPQQDLEKRRREQAEKKARLRNPLFFISPTRLSVRNLSRSVDDHQLQRVVVRALRKGLDEGKVGPEDMRAHLRAAGQDATPDMLQVRRDRGLQSLSLWSEVVV